MPWTPADAPKYTKTANTRKLKRMWANVANSALKSCMDAGGSEEKCAPGAITKANGVVKKRAEMEAIKMPNLQEVTKTLNGKSYPSSSFLVVPDKTKPSTWALPVKSPDGKPDHRLMGAAWAALHGGYRGNKYEGEGKEEAIRKLKAMYKGEDMETPAENAEVGEVAEYMGDMEMAYVPSGIVSFDQYDAMQDTEETLHEIQELTNVFTQMVRNVAFWFDGDKIEQLGILFDQYVERLNIAINGEQPEMPEDDTNTTGEEVEEFAETESGSLLKLNEAENGNSVLTMEVLVIKPGWGNKIDNHYYSAEMLKQNSEKFINAKMYETDHRDNEKSTRTWVSTITGISGFDEAGSPIATVKVHDPGFAERIRNLNALGLLDKMECSIYATGKAAVGFEQDGRKGKKVTELVEVHSVDWVTRAGAGGKAQSLVENQEGGNTMPENEKDKVTTPAAETTPPEKPKTETVPVNETETKPAETQSESTEQEKPDNAAPEQPVYLEQAAVDDVLAKSSLLEIGKYFLSKQKYANLDELNRAIADAVEKLTAEMGSGRPFGMGGGSTSVLAPSLQEVESAVNEAANRVNDRFFKYPKFGG